MTRISANESPLILSHSYLKLVASLGFVSQSTILSPRLPTIGPSGKFRPLSCRSHSRHTSHRIQRSASPRILMVVVGMGAHGNRALHSSPELGVLTCRLCSRMCVIYIVLPIYITCPIYPSVLRRDDHLYVKIRPCRRTLTGKAGQLSALHSFKLTSVAAFRLLNLLLPALFDICLWHSLFGGTVVAGHDSSGWRSTSRHVYTGKRSYP